MFNKPAFTGIPRALAAVFVLLILLSSCGAPPTTERTSTGIGSTEAVPSATGQTVTVQTTTVPTPTEPTTVPATTAPTTAEPTPTVPSTVPTPTEPTPTMPTPTVWEEGVFSFSIDGTIYKNAPDAFDETASPVISDRAVFRNGSGVPVSITLIFDSDARELPGGVENPLGFVLQPDDTYSFTAEEPARLAGLYVDDGNTAAYLFGSRALGSLRYTPVDTVLICGDISSEADLRFEIPIGLTVRPGSALRLNSLTVATGRKGVIALHGEGSGALRANRIFIDAPNCTIDVDDSLYPALTGGNGGSRLASLTLGSADNPGVPFDYTFTIHEDSASVTIDCPIGGFDFSKTVLRGRSVCEDKSTDLLCTADLNGGVLTLEDEKGGFYRYALTLIRTETKLPVVSINTDGGQSVSDKVNYVGATVSIDCSCAEGFPSLEASRAGIRGRGNSTWKWDKKPYKIKFEEKTSVLGLPAAKDWVLLANYADKSLIRNTIALEAAAYLGNGAFFPTQYPVDLFVNGEYLGVYTIGEQIETAAGRVQLPKKGAPDEVGYLLEVGGTNEDDVWNVTCFNSTLLRYVKIKSPGDDETRTREYADFIKDYCERANAAVRAGEGYEDYIDVDALIDWFILHELSWNLDSSFRRSCFLSKAPGGKLVMGPSWDFDLAFGNFFRDPQNYKGWACLYDKDDYIGENWMTHLLKNEAFREKLAARFAEVKDGLCAFLYGEIDRLYELVSPSAAFNFRKWDILSVRAGYQGSVMTKYDTYEKQIGYLKNYITGRCVWMAQELGVQ